MICQVCNESTDILIRGKCKECDPVAHRNYTEAKAEQEPEPSQDEAA